MRFRARFSALLATIVTLAVLAVAPTSASADDHGAPAEYTITFENLTGGQWLTPPNYAIHDRAADVFTPGHPASEPLQAVAENGNVPALAGALTEAVDNAGLGVSGVANPDDAGPIGPGQTRTITVTSSENRLSVAAMIICTNDGFAGLDSRRLPGYDGQTRTYYLSGWDAGTEINTEAREDLVTAPFCGEEGGSDETNPALAENSVITRHQGILGIGDLDPAIFNWHGPVLKLTVTRIG